MFASLLPSSLWQTLALSALLLLSLYLLKQYFNGGVFRIPKGLNLSGKNVVITGASTGIGKETLRELAKLGCNIIFGARDRLKSEKTVKEIIKETNNKNIDYIHLDLAVKQSVESFAQAVSFPHIDYLVNNAGIMSIPEKRLTKEGNEMHWAVNCLGHFYLTHLLWEKINNSTFFKVINLSSIAHKNLLAFFAKPKFNLQDINYASTPYDRNQAYSLSKVYVTLFTTSLAAKIDPKKGMTACLHPGVVRTELVREFTKGVVGVMVNMVYPFFMFFTKSPRQGNQTSMFCLLSEDVESGEYYADCKKNSKNSVVTLQNGEKLWKLCEKSMGIEFKI